MLYDTMGKLKGWNLIVRPHWDLNWYSKKVFRSLNMIFQNPQMVYGFFALLIPIIIHLFNLQRYKKVVFSIYFCCISAHKLIMQIFTMMHPHENLNTYTFSNLEFNKSTLLVIIHNINLKKHYFRGKMWVKWVQLTAFFWTLF